VLLLSRYTPEKMHQSQNFEGGSGVQLDIVDGLVNIFRSKNTWKQLDIE